MAILTKFLKKDFNAVLKNYNLGSHKRHRHIPFALGNTNYILWTTKGKYFLKIFESGSDSDVNFQIKIQRRVYKKGVEIPKIFLNKKGKELTMHNKKRVMITEFVNGRHPHSYNKKVLKELSENFVELHKVLLTLKLRGNVEFLPLDKMHRFINKNKDPFVKKALPKLMKEINSLNKSKMRKCIIHGDLNEVNLMMNKGKLVSFIDWDDAHRDYLVRDIGVFLTHTVLTTASIRPELMSYFLKIYDKGMKLSLDEKKGVYYSIKVRLLGSATWIYLQCKNHPEQVEKLTRYIENNKTRFKIIDSITADDFVKLFD